MSKKRKDISYVPLPHEFVEAMEKILGKEEATCLASSLDDPPAVSIRINRAKVKDIDGFMDRFKDYGVSPVPWCDSGFYLDRRPDFVHDPLLHAGVYYVQEAASMIYESIISNLSETASAQPLKILDLCAAPGGKSTAILNALKHPHILVANEFDSSRVRILKENLEKWGNGNVIITNSPTSGFSKLSEFFDIVAVDAPCSGEGMMRREPIARSQWSNRLISQCASLQKEILNDAITTLRPGGVLIYSTCTFNTSENEENVKWILENFSLRQIEESRHFYPHRNRCEGLFTAVFRKDYEDADAGTKNNNSVDISKITGQLKKSGIKIVCAGTEVTVDKGNIKIPSSKSCVAIDFDKESFPTVNLTLAQAKDYIARKPLSLGPEYPKGYLTVYFGGYPLGLVKNIGPRANNLFPSEWRVLS